MTIGCFVVMGKRDGVIGRDIIEFGDKTQEIGRKENNPRKRRISGRAS